MRWLILLTLPVFLLSWKEKSAFGSDSRTNRESLPQPVKETVRDLSLQQPDDTLKLGNLIFADFFSPNADGHNDQYIIKNLEAWPYDNTSLKVFNRWGEVVYLASPYLNDWDGTNNQGGAIGNKILIEGVYYFEFYDGNGNKATGKITIKR